ncbi:MAG: hypothetical protein CM15mP78_11280 [Candidatus Poseidoniales archaeon]|nr:MAG: hypothetical protein CM15mP78_11280 [Candidatus Poseidoniales archaeon]
MPCTDASQASGAAGMGAGNIIAAKAEAFSHYDASGWAAALDAVVPQGTVITGASPQSKDLAARFAARRNLSVVQDAVNIEGTTITSPVYSGKAMQTVAVSGPVVVSVRSNVFAPSEGGATDVAVIDTTGNVATSVKEFMARASNASTCRSQHHHLRWPRMGSPDNFTHLEAMPTPSVLPLALLAAVDSWEPFLTRCKWARRENRQSQPLHRRRNFRRHPAPAGMRSSEVHRRHQQGRRRSNLPTRRLRHRCNVEDALPVLHESLKGMMA